MLGVPGGIALWAALHLSRSSGAGRLPTSWTVRLPGENANTWGRTLNQLSNAMPQAATIPADWADQPADDRIALAKALGWVGDPTTEEADDWIRDRVRHREAWAKEAA